MKETEVRVAFIVSENGVVLRVSCGKHVIEKKEKK